MRTTHVKRSQLPWVGSATLQLDWVPCSERRLEKVCNLSCGPLLDERSTRVVLASKAVSQGSVLVDLLHRVGLVLQDDEIAAEQGVGVRDVSEVTPARAGDSSSTFALFGGSGFRRPWGRKRG